MSSRPVLFFIVRIRVGGEKKFNLFLPLPFFVLLSFVDMADDLACLVKLFAPRLSYETALGKKAMPAAVIRTVTGAIGGVLWELMLETGPLDIVDVDVNNGKDKVRVSCITR